MFLKFTDFTEIVDETVEEEECKTIEEEMCSQPTPQFGEKCQDVEVSKGGSPTYTKHYHGFHYNLGFWLIYMQVGDFCVSRGLKKSVWK